MSILADQLRAAIVEDGRSLYRIAKEAEVPYSVLHRFATGLRDNVTLDVASKIAEVLEMRLTAPKRRGKKGGKQR